MRTEKHTCIFTCNICGEVNVEIMKYGGEGNVYHKFIIPDGWRTGRMDFHICPKHVISVDGVELPESM